MIHKNNRVYLDIVREDKDALANLVSQCPFNPVLPENLAVSLIYSKSSIENFKPKDTIHNVVIAGARVWFDPYYRINSFVILLDAPSLVKRRNEIIKEYDAIPFFSEYVPHITVVYNLPPYKRPKYRWWVNQMIDTFESRHKGNIIRLKNESVQSTDDKIFIPLSEIDGTE